MVKVLVSVRLPKESYDKLCEYCKENDVSLSFVISNSLSYYLNLNLEDNNVIIDFTKLFDGLKKFNK